MSGVWTVLASLLLSGHARSTVRVLVGEDVLLPCPCVDDPGQEYLVWQIGEHTVVDQAIAGTTRQDQAGRYRNRTRLFYHAGNGNCSLRLLRARVSDAEAYSCLYLSRAGDLANVTMTLEVTVPHRPYSVQCSNDSTGEQYRCSANGGFPEGRVHWLWDGRAVERLQGLVSELRDQDRLTGLYDITSTLRTNPRNSTLQCVVETPSLQHNITADCRWGAESTVGSEDLLVSGEMKASLAVGSVFLLLSIVCLTVFLKAWRPCPRDRQAHVLYLAAPLAEVLTAEGGSSPGASRDGTFPRQWPEVITVGGRGLGRAE